MKTKVIAYVEKGAEKHFEKICREHGVRFRRGGPHKKHLVRYLIGRGDDGEVVGCGSVLCEECDHEFGSYDCVEVRKEEDHELRYKNDKNGSG